MRQMGIALRCYFEDNDTVCRMILSQKRDPKSILAENFVEVSQTQFAILSDLPTQQKNLSTG
jgi:hypothetical protein